MSTWFVKAEVNGNDFIILEETAPTSEEVRRMSDRKFGIGADQIIVFSRRLANNTYDVCFFNSDGSKAAMCGNGLIALTKSLADSHRKRYFVGNRECESFIDSDGYCCLILSKPTIIKKEKWGKFVDVGNKHIVCICNNPDVFSFINEYNIHFVEKIDNHTLRVRTYERGAGPTLACGSGAIASAYAYGNAGGVTNIIHDNGGKSIVDLSNLNIVILKAQANIVFRGEIKQL
jgi:diaminopimelate epimerase